MTDDSARWLRAINVNGYSIAMMAPTEEGPWELARPEDFIDAHHWRTASSAAMRDLPHAYTVRVPGDETFDLMVNYVREHGTVRYFGKRPITYLVVGDYEYWTMPGPVDKTGVINRQTLAQRDAFLARSRR